MDKHRLSALAELADEIIQRRGAPTEASYTARLLSQGIERCAKKFGEEAVEAALAAMTGDRAHLVSETADVVYHLLVMLAAADVPLEAVMAELARRRGTSGIAEKASRHRE
jgi:phosphoribosyl-ATP pyrophosphohydrolase